MKHHWAATRWAALIKLANATTQALGNTGVGNIRFRPQHVARYYYVVNTSTLSLKETHGQGFKVFPNPTDGYLKIESSLDQIELAYEICDLKGRLIASSTVSHENGFSQLALPASLATGTYIFKCKAGIAKFSVRWDRIGLKEDLVQNQHNRTMIAAHYII